MAQGAAIKLSEAAIQRTCSDILAAEGWRMLRTDPCSDRRRGKGFGEIGMADCLYIRYPSQLGLPPSASVLWVEWKSPIGKATLRQIEWHKAERARGAMTAIAGVDFPASIEGFMAWGRRNGILRGAAR